MNGITSEKRGLIEETFRAGGSIRAAMFASGSAKQTVSDIYRELGERPKCGCGLASDHRGWCSARYEKSEKRQATVQNFNRKGPVDAMQSNPMIDNTPKAPKVFMKDGAWLVSPEERPKGWESMGISEQPPALRARALPNALRELPAVNENSKSAVGLEPTSKDFLEVQPAGHHVNEISNIRAGVGIQPGGPVAEAKPGKWTAIIEKACALKGRETMQVEVFLGMTATKFKSHLRSVLSGAKEAKLDKWSVTMGIDDRHVSVGKSGVWPSAIRDIEAARANEVKIEAKERTEHTITERSMTVTQTVGAPVPAPSQQQLPIEAARSFDADNSPEEFLSQEIGGMPDAPEIPAFIEMNLMVWGSDEDAASSVFEREIPNMIEQIRAYREAKPRTDELISKWATGDPCFYGDVSPEGIRNLWMILQKVMRDKRLMELRLIDIAKRVDSFSPYERKLLRRDIAELLPESDRGKFQWEAEP